MSVTKPKVWLTADLHFGHRNIIDYSDRPFDDVAEMNEALVRNWNERVAPTDVAWILGDVAMGQISESLLHVSRLNGRKFLVPGNHDRCFPGRKKVRPQDVTMYEWAGLDIKRPFESALLPMPDGSRLPVSLCHFPYEGDSQPEDRFTEHRPTDRGHWLLHGHVHERWRVNGRMINVGVDVWDYAPVAAETLAALIAEATVDATPTPVKG